jgi:predicted transcriptional regulator
MAVDTKEQVAQLLDKGMEAKDIAEKLGKTKATIYNHIANIRKDRGDTTPRKRGRPPKAQSESKTAPKPTGTSTRQRPPVGDKPKPTPAETPKPTAKDNGHDAHRFPKVRAAIEAELADARRNVTVLEKMLEAVA